MWSDIADSRVTSAQPPAAPQAAPSAASHSANRSTTAQRQQPAGYPVVTDQRVITNPYVEQFALHPTPVRLSSGEEVVVPFRFWRTQALLLTGSAD